MPLLSQCAVGSCLSFGGQPAPASSSKPPSALPPPTANGHAPAPGGFIDRVQFAAAAANPVSGATDGRSLSSKRGSRAVSPSEVSSSSDNGSRQQPAGGTINAKSGGGRVAVAGAAPQQGVAVGKAAPGGTSTISRRRWLCGMVTMQTS